MFLMTETLEGMDTLTEINESTGKKELFIEGVFAQWGVDNRNGRVYPESILEREVSRYNEEFIKTKRALGELSHPQSLEINPDRVSHLITSLVKEGNDFVGKAKILDTPCGQIVKGIVEGGATIGVSTRGRGTVKSIKGGINEVQKDFSLATIDIVTNPSAIDAFVEGIMEGVIWIPKQEEATQLIKEAKSINLADIKAKIFINAMKSM